MTTPTKTQEIAAGSFENLGLAPKIIETLTALKLTVPTPIQSKSIPFSLEGQDLIGIAQTGTGKTLAFALPLIQRLSRGGGRGLIVLPTRELALQVDETFQRIARYIPIRTAVLIGGENIEKQKRQLARQPHILITTPGRLIDHLEQRTVKLNDIRILVLDEADRMLDMGFAPQIKKILQVVPKDRQTLLFSATMPTEIATIAEKDMRSPVRVEIARAGTTAEHIKQELYVVRKDQKNQLLEKILSDTQGSVLVFSRTKHGAKRLTTVVQSMGHRATEIHSNRSLNQRREALAGFKSGKYRVLIATDIAARGIDVTGIELVINFDLPDQSEDYVHRIGRTGRAGLTGRAVSFATPDQGQDVRAIERLTRTVLAITPLPTLPRARFVPPSAPSYGDERRHSTGGGHHRSAAPHAHSAHAPRRAAPYHSRGR